MASPSATILSYLSIAWDGDLGPVLTVLWRAVVLSPSGRKNVLRKLLRIPYRRLKAGFSVCTVDWAVDCVCLLLEFWVKCTRCERLLPVKHFDLTCLLFYRRLKISLDSEQPMLKEKRIIPSVWGGIKGFEHFLRGEYFSDCASDEFMSWFRRVELIPACILSVYSVELRLLFFTCPDLLPLQNQLYLCLQSKNHTAVITH